MLRACTGKSHGKIEKKMHILRNLYFSQNENFYCQNGIIVSHFHINNSDFETNKDFSLKIFP